MVKSHQNRNRLAFRSQSPQNGPLILPLRVPSVWIIYRNGHCRKFFHSIISVFHHSIVATFLHSIISLSNQDSYMRVMTD